MKESPREVRVSMVTMAILLHNVLLASKDDNIGFVDAFQTLGNLLKSLEKDVWVRTEDLESALYYSNMLSEDAKFWHPFGTNFKTFLKRNIPDDIEFDLYYNLLHIKEE